MAKYETVHVKLAGRDGNIFSIIGRAAREMRRKGVSNEEIEAFTDEVTSQHDYIAALGVVEKWVDVS